MSTQPRTYTRSFAQRAAALYPHMIKTTVPPTAETSEYELGRLWASAPDLDQWDDAYLKEVVRYLAGAKGLKIPSGWEWIIPKQM